MRIGKRERGCVCVCARERERERERERYDETEEMSNTKHYSHLVDRRWRETQRLTVVFWSDATT